MMIRKVSLAVRAELVEASVVTQQPTLRPAQGERQYQGERI
jgi:hypothetical protein